MARREEREYREYLSDEQRCQTGCSAGRMPGISHAGHWRSTSVVSPVLLRESERSIETSLITQDPLEESLRDILAILPR